MTLWPVFTDRLPFALPHFQHLDEARPEHERDNQGRHDRPAGAERYVAKDIERLERVGEWYEIIIEHRGA
jgi:hypothetical protein